MIICPICHSKYEFQESLLGQRVSCECGCSWVLTMDQVETKADDECMIQTDSQAKKYIYSDDNDILRKAFELIINERRASTSYLQRRLNISYNEASNILFELDLMV